MVSKDKVKSWLKDKHNFAFVILIVVAILFRGYYFMVTLNQPLWWDEAGYMSAAKNYAGIGAYSLESIRSSGFARTMSIFYGLGIDNESVIRFFGLFIPSIILLVLTYLLLAKMYEDKRIALIGTIIMTILWENLFYSNRFHTENFALIFQYIALLILFKMYSSSNPFKNKWLITGLIVSSLLSIWYRPGNVFFIPAVIAFMVVMHTPFFAKNKSRKLASILVLVGVVALFFILLSALSSNPLVSAYYHPSDPLSWSSFNVFIGFFKSPVSFIPSLIFYTFLIGLISAVLGVYLYFPKISKEPASLSLTNKSNILNLFLLFFVMFGFVFLIRPNGIEYRWFFPLLPALLGFASLGIVNFSDWVGKKTNNKHVALALIIIIMVLGVYTQFKIVDPLIKNKLSSYEQVKDAGLWIKENSEPTDIILSTSYPQISYYSERKTVTYAGMTQSEFESFLRDVKPKYLMVSVFEGNPDWLMSWLQTNEKNLIAAQVYSIQDQPVAIIYYPK